MSYDPTYDDGGARRQFLIQRLAPIAIAVIAAVFTAVKGCQVGPFGRMQVLGIDSSEEAQLGAQAFEQVLAQEAPNIVQSGPLLQMVKQIGGRLAAAAQRPEVLDKLQLKPQKFDWQLRVIRSKQVNAFCLPGGKIVVYTGILPVAENASALAAVMGHEIGHALAHHGAERMAHEKLANVGQAAIAQSMGDMDPAQRLAIMKVLNAGIKFGGILPYSRKHETEADHIGVVLMAAAGYNPQEASRLWMRMEKAGGSAPAEFASTHPSNARRIHDIQVWLPDAEAVYNAAQKAPNDGASLPRDDHSPRPDE